MTKARRNRATATLRKTGSIQHSNGNGHNGKDTKPLMARKDREDIKTTLLGTDPTRDYQSSRQSYYGELFVQQIPQWRLWTGRMMLSSDPLVKFMLNTRNAALASGEIKVKSKNPRLKKWVEDQWNFLWNHHALKLMAPKKWGFAPLQVVWKFEKEDGLIHIKTLKDFQPEDTRALEVRNRLVGHRVQGQKLFFPQALWIKFDAECGSPYGTGCLRRAYPAWYEKWMDHGAKRLLQLRMIKDSYIGDIFWYPPNMLVEIPDGNGGSVKLSYRDLMRELGENRLSGGALTMPMVYDNNGKELTKYTPPQDVGYGSQIFDWNDKCDEGILQGGDVPIEVVKAQESGSGYSGRSVPMLSFLSTCTQEFKDIVNCVNEQVLRPAAWLNFGGEPEYDIEVISLVKSFSDDTQGSPMGGAAIGGNSQAQQVEQQQLPPDSSGRGVQYGEEEDLKESYANHREQKYGSRGGAEHHHESENKFIRSKTPEFGHHHLEGKNKEHLHEMLQSIHKHGLQPHSPKGGFHGVYFGDHGDTPKHPAEAHLKVRIPEHHKAYDDREVRDYNHEKHAGPDHVHKDSAFYTKHPIHHRHISVVSPKGGETPLHEYLKSGHRDVSQHSEDEQQYGGGKSAEHSFYKKLPQHAFEGESHSIPIHLLHVHKEAVHRTTQDLAAGRTSKTPKHPIEVFYHTKRKQFLVTDGLHRLVAAHQSGKTHIPATFEAGPNHEFHPPVEPHERHDWSSQHSEDQSSNGGIPSNGVNFQGSDIIQFDESETIVKLRQLVARGMAAKAKKAQERIKSLGEATLDLPTLTGLIEREIKVLAPLLTPDLTSLGLYTKARGVLDVGDSLPSHVIPTGRPLQATINAPEIKSVLGGEINLPALDDVLERLERSPIARGSNYLETAARVREGAFAITTGLTDKAVIDVKELLSDAVREGQTKADFIEAVVTKLGSDKFSEAHLENVLRTNQASLYSDARMEAMGHNLVADAFPYCGVSATHDAITRPGHLALERLGLNGTNVYRLQDPAFVKYRGPFDYQCRCSWYPVTVEQAARLGVIEAKDWMQRAVEMAKDKGGTFYQYLVVVKPSNPQYVTMPDIPISAGFQRGTI